MGRGEDWRVRGREGDASAATLVAAQGNETSNAFMREAGGRVSLDGGRQVGRALSACDSARVPHLPPPHQGSLAQPKQLCEGVPEESWKREEVWGENLCCDSTSLKCHQACGTGRRRQGAVLGGWRRWRGDMKQSKPSPPHSHTL